MASNCKESQDASTTPPKPKAPKTPHSENHALQRAHTVYYEGHRDERLEHGRQYIVDNRELVNERMRVYLKKRRDIKKHNEEFLKKERAAALKYYYRKKEKKALEKQAAQNVAQTSRAKCSLELK